jgi:Fe-S cluster biosynthesis and repair protein YggX
MSEDMLQQRISQWEKMTSEDPDNAMGWFSLGNAYKEADRDEDAARALRKAIELDPGYSRAYQILAQVLIRRGANDQAAEVLTRGYEVAAERGDVMPQKAMGSLLQKLGLEVPEVEVAEQRQPEPVGGDQIIDRRTGRPGTKMPRPPFRGPVGQFIQDHYSQETWREWISQGTKVINELRLDLSKREHQDVYDQQMYEWLGFTPEEADHYAEQQSESSSS